MVRDVSPSSFRPEGNFHDRLSQLGAMLSFGTIHSVSSMLIRDKIFIISCC